MGRGKNTKNWETRYNNTLLKEGKGPKDVRSYRPVALTNILCKIVERIINKRHVWNLKREKIIYDRQFGFRKK